ncbi:hypothetical protein BDW59DRAFT_150613 [Aspergillus cavernicola]|uniref:DNA repair protein Rad26 n=1 Tax=Aspergillus cavernicola TaxID=176166 RepID=A0ABR4HZB3_9EURO
MEDNGDDFYSDDGFDDLPPDALHQLEQDAFRATQVENPSQSEPTVRLNWDSRDFTDHYPQYEGTRRPAPSRIASNTALQPPAHLHTGLTNDYGALDVGELDAEVFDIGTGSVVALDQTIAFSDRPSFRHDAIVLDEEEPMQTEGGTSYYSALLKEHELLAQKLQQENERYLRLESELASTRSMAETKAGEIAIIRSNQAKLAEDYERQLAALRRAMAEEMTKYKEEVEATRAEGKMLATENAFLKQDLAEEVLRTNQMKVKAQLEEKAQPVTPKKSKVLPFRDGFDDNEILAESPSKSGRSKRMTPAVTSKKRRRTSEGSPTPLHLSSDGEPMGIEAAGDLLDEAMIDVAIDRPIAEESAQKVETQDMQVVKRILSHRTFHHKTDLEVMAGLAFPSQPERTLSSILLEETTKLDLGNYAVEHMQAILLLWSQALKEKFFQPIPMFLEITRSILAIDTASTLKMIDRLVPVLQTSGDINGIPRFKHSPVSRQNYGQVRRTPSDQLNPLVDSTEVLAVLYVMACRSLSFERHLEDFWRHIRYDFVLMMLNCSQRVSDISLTLSLLMTSIRADSFGSIQETEQDQNANENYIVDRVANLLSETLQPDEGQPPYARSEICDMRLEALSFLMNVAFNPIVPASTRGSLVIVSHPTALARLIRAMHDELDSLYTFSPERDMHASLVNNLMRLIYSVIRRHPQEVDLQSKLYRIPGGKQKFLVVLTRLAFSEGLVLEAGIEDETVEMAHEILDDAVNPQEAEALLEAFPHAKWEEDTEMKE